MVWIFFCRPRASSSAFSARRLASRACCSQRRARSIALSFSSFIACIFFLIASMAAVGGGLRAVQKAGAAAAAAAQQLCQLRDSNACNYGVGIGVIAFLAAIGFLVGEYLFEQMSSVKTRKHYVLGDLGFSGFWSFLYFVGFCYLTNQWSNAESPPLGVGVNNVQAAIAFSFFSIFTWAGCAWFAFLRFRQGSEAAFAPSYEADPAAMPGGGPYTSYPMGQEADAAYQEPPFSGSQTRGPVGTDFQAPAY